MAVEDVLDQAHEGRWFDGDQDAAGPASLHNPNLDRGGGGFCWEFPLAGRGKTPREPCFTLVVQRARA